MKLFLFILLFSFISVAMDAQVFTIVYEKARFPYANPGNMTIDHIKKAKITFSNLRWHYTLQGDDKVIYSRLDSIVQHCDLGPVTSHAVNKLFHKGEGKDWELYTCLEDWENSTLAYKILSNEDEEEWIIDFNRKKNILGYDCFWAHDKLNSDRTIWLTLELPFSVTPFGPLNVPGVVLEYSDSEKKSIAKKIEIDWDDKVCVFEKSNYTIKEFKNYSTFFSTVLSSNSSTKISSNMVNCKKD